MSAAEVQTREVQRKLKEHADDIVGAWSRWYSVSPQRPQYKGFLMVEHAIPGAAIYFYANAELVIQRLALPKDLEDRQGELKGHLGPELWNQWETILSNANSHLDSALRLWSDIREAVSAIGSKAGFFASNAPNTDFPDVYWPEMVIASIWQERKTFADKLVHSWESVKVVDGTLLLTKSDFRHATDAFHVWSFESSNMIRSQSLDALHEFIKAWADESFKMEPKLLELERDRERVEREVNQFRSALKRLESEYAQTGSLSGACPTCKPWLDELRARSQSELRSHNP